MNRAVPGLLIEGVDYVGKTTVATRLVEVLNADGHEATMRKCYMSGSPLVSFLDRQAARTESMLERDSYYSAAILLDLRLYTPRPQFLVQDRHWLSQAGRNLFFHPDHELIPAGLLEATHLPFRFNVLLTSSLEAKIERSSARPAKSPRDRFLKAHPAAHQEYEAFLTRLVPADEDWTILDTTGRTVDEVVTSILGLLDGADFRVSAAAQSPLLHTSRSRS